MSEEPAPGGETEQPKSRTTSPGPMPPADFASHVYTIGIQALIFLGKQPHPESNKYTRNLELARYHIDTLEVLREKTKGNLTEDEAKLIENLLHTCRLAYVDETGKGG